MWWKQHLLGLRKHNQRLTSTGLWSKNKLPFRLYEIFHRIYLRTWSKSLNSVECRSTFFIVCILINWSVFCATNFKCIYTVWALWSWNGSHANYYIKGPIQNCFILYKTQSDYCQWISQTKVMWMGKIFYIKRRQNKQFFYCSTTVITETMVYSHAHILYIKLPAYVFLAACWHTISLPNNNPQTKQTSENSHNTY